MNRSNVREKNNIAKNYILCFNKRMRCRKFDGGGKIRRFRNFKRKKFLEANRKKEKLPSLEKIHFY